MITAIYNSWAAFLNVINAFTVDRVGRIRIILIGMVRGPVALTGW